MYQLLVSGSVLGLFLQVVPITCLVGILYAVWRHGRIRKGSPSPGWGAEAVRLLFICYLTGLVNLILVPNNLWSAIWAYLFIGYSSCQVGPLFTLEFNLVPGLFRWAAGQMTLGSWTKTMLVGNVLMFLPMGFFLPLVSEKIRRGNILKAALLIPAAVEVFQPLIGRSFDVDDILCNLLGILAGFGIFMVLERIAPRMVEKFRSAPAKNKERP
jgi:glycopeptide antibiotics resistance protein